MEIILAQKGTKEIVWGPWGGPHQEGDSVLVDTMDEVCILDDFISYNNVLSTEPIPQSNDWEMQLTIECFKKLSIKIGDWIYAKETEFGGVIETIERVDRVIKLSGVNFRGYLARHIITPPLEEKGKFGSYVYRTLDSNKLLWDVWEFDHSLISTHDMWYDPYVVGYSANSGVIIDDKWRYDSFLSAMTKSLNKFGMRLETKNIYVDYDSQSNNEYRFPTYWRGTQSFMFALSSQPVKDYSEDDLFSQDYDIRISSGKSIRNTRKYLWCLGSGELQNRTVVVLQDGLPVDIGSVDTMGSLWNSEIFDYPNAESKEELIKAGQERYFERNVDTEYVELFVDDSKIEFFLGDIIGGEDFITGIEAKAEIKSKELTIENGTTEIKYTIGG